MSHYPHKWIRKLASFCLISILLVSILQAAITYPAPTAYKYINDYTNTLSNEEKTQIIAIGKELEGKTGAQAVIVIIPSTEQIPIEYYANGLFKSWGIGRGKEDNGLLLLLALNDHSWRIEVGRGLEGALPDALTNRIMIESAKPSFIEGNYSEGLLRAYSLFTNTIAAEYGVTLDYAMSPLLPTDFSDQAYFYQKGGIGIVVLLIVAVILDLLFNRGRFFSFFLQMLFWSNISNRRGPRGGGGGFGNGGFGGGSSNGGGSSGGW